MKRKWKKRELSLEGRRRRSQEEEETLSAFPAARHSSSLAG